jgi:hypothetical protein
MPEYTPNYNLIKPSEDEYYDIKDFNQNADILDTAIKTAADAAAALAPNPSDWGYVPNTPWMAIRHDAEYQIYYRGMNNMVFVLIRAYERTSGVKTTIPTGFRPLGKPLIFHDVWNVSHTGAVSRTNTAAEGSTCLCYGTM